MSSQRSTPGPSRRVQLIVALGVLALALGLARGAIAIPAEAGYGGVGPNFLPWLVSAMLGICGLGLAFQAARRGFEDMDPPSGAQRPDLPGFFWISAGLLANAALITTAGFILSCTLCFVLAVQGFRSAEGAARRGVLGLLKDILLGLAIAAPVYWMFTQLLAINLPGLTSTGWL